MKSPKGLLRRKSKIENRKSKISFFIPLLRVILGGVLASLRVEERNAAGLNVLLAEKRPFVFAFWHGSMMYFWWRLRRHHPACLVSRSKDGQILSDILRGWGYHLIRGSSSAGSAEAMDAMRQTVRDGHILSITPDGPRGPRHVMKMGAARVAQTTGVPIILCAVGFRSRRSLRSWDMFEVPAPFSRVCVEYSDPLIIPVDAEGDALENIRLGMQQSMRALHERAAAAVER